MVQIPVAKRSIPAKESTDEDENNAVVNNAENQTTCVSLVGPEMENVNISEGSSENPRQPIF